MVLSKKVCILGDFAVGKTSLIRRYVYSTFSEEYQTTLGVNVYKRADSVTNARGGAVEITQVLWDIEGMVRHADLLRSYIQGSSGAVIIGDITRPETITALRGHALYFQALQPGRPVVFALNKLDLLEEGQKLPDCTPLTRDFETHVAQTSAATGLAVDRLFQSLAERMIRVQS